jgi:hypothetical protein
MNPLIETLLKQAEQLPQEDRLELISRLADQMRVEIPARSQKRGVREFRGIAPGLLAGMDAQEWVNQLRDEWDDREKTLYPER